MEGFTTRSEGRVHIHMLKHTRFKTKDISIRLHVPLQRDDVTRTALLPHMWMNGTKTYPTNRDVTVAADQLYGTVIRTTLGKRGGFHVMEVNASIPDVSRLTEEAIVEQAVELMCDILLNHDPQKGAFSPSLVTQEIDLHRRRIEAARDDKMSYALQQCLAHVADGTAAALPRLGYLEDLDALTAESLFATYEALALRAHVHVYLVGPFDDAQTLADHFLQRLQPVFHRASSQLVEHATVVPLPRMNRSDVSRVHERQDVAQGQLDIGYRTGIGFSDALYPKLLMMNGVFGGFAHSKLFANVREKHSLAYTVWSHLDAMTGAVAVMTGIDPTNYEQALEIIEEQLTAIRQGDITDDEMTYTLRGIENQYTVLLDQPAALANWHYSGVLSGTEREIPELLSTLRSISAADVAEVASQLEQNTIYFLSGKETV